MNPNKSTRKGRGIAAFAEGTVSHTNYAMKNGAKGTEQNVAQSLRRWGGGWGSGTPPKKNDGAAVSVMSLGKPHQSYDLQTWSCGLVAWP